MIKIKRTKSRLLTILIITVLLATNFIFFEKNEAKAFDFSWGHFNLWSHSTPRVLKKKNRRVCKDSRALNFSRIGKHDEKVCYYPWGWGITEENKKVSRDVIRNKMCQSSMILFEKMQEGDRNGEVSKVTGKIIKEVKILQTYLANLDLYEELVDGFFDKEVAKSVKDLQSSLRIEKTGELDSATINEFFDACK